MSNLLIIQKLIDIYADNISDNIGNIATYQDIATNHGDSLWFLEAHNLIKKAKKDIESQVLIQTSSKSQVTQSLYLLYQKKKTSGDAFDYTYRLLVKRFMNEWTKEQFTYFDNVHCLIKYNINDYFLSFTQRRANHSEKNVLHNNYRYFIVDTLGITNWKKELEESHLKNTNLLARAINKILADKMHKGFYFPEHQNDNNDVATRLEKNCKGSFVFIQLIHNIIFQCKTDGSENYCHTEYNIAKTSIEENRRLYLLAEKEYNDLIKKHEIHEDYNEWHNEVASKSKIHLPFTQTLKRDIIASIQASIKNDVCNKIKQLRDDLFNNAPQ